MSRTELDLRATRLELRAAVATALEFCARLRLNLASDEWSPGHTEAYREHLWFWAMQVVSAKQCVRQTLWVLRELKIQRAHELRALQHDRELKSFVRRTRRLVRDRERLLGAS